MNVDLGKIIVASLPFLVALLLWKIIEPRIGGLLGG